MADGEFGWSEGIAALSLAVSIGALAWANVSARAAERANNFQLHNYQKQTYLEFCKLWHAVQVDPCSLKRNTVEKFHEHTLTAYLYFPAKLAQSIEAFYQSCCAASIYREQATRHQDRAHEYLSINDYRVAGELTRHQRAAKSFEEQLRNEGSKAYDLGQQLNTSLKETINIIGNTPSILERITRLYNKPFDWEEPQ